MNAARLSARRVAIQGAWSAEADVVVDEPDRVDDRDRPQDPTQRETVADRGYGPQVDRRRDAPSRTTVPQDHRLQRPRRPRDAYRPRTRRTQPNTGGSYIRAGTIPIKSWNRRPRSSTTSGTTSVAGLAVPVVHVGRSAREHVVGFVSGPHADLAAVRVHRDGWHAPRREHQHTHRLVGLVAHEMRSRGLLWEVDDVERVEGIRALGMAKRRTTAQHEQPLLLAVLIVIRADCLAGSTPGCDVAMVVPALR